MVTATPPESAREAKLKARVIWSYWAVILLLGLPVWYITTSIYRASLPTEQMLESHDDDSWYPISICVTSSSLALTDVQRVAQETQAKVKQDSHDLLNFHIEAHEQCKTEDFALVVDLHAGAQTQVREDATTEVVTAEYSEAQAIPDVLAPWVLTAFKEEHAAIAFSLIAKGKSTDKLQRFAGTVPEQLRSQTEKAATRAFKPSPAYHLTFSLLTAGSAPSDWDIKQVIDKYIKPLTVAFPPSVNVSIASQVLLYSQLSSTVQPEQTETGHKLKKHDLTSFINAAEWPLSPSIGTGPTVNFIVYVPEQGYMPLSIEDEQSNSWLIPQWGGITIINPPLQPVPETELGLMAPPDHLEERYLQPAFQTFQAQLLQLLGVPQSPILPLSARIKACHRLFGLSMYLRTTSNLGSLARLEQSLSQIPIPKHVLHYVENALSKLSVFRQSLTQKTSSQWSVPLRAVQEAYVASEKAFFDKSMVGQVYFPDEHKVAVYLPLLGPIGVPLVIGLIREVKGIVAKAKARA